MTHLNFIFPQSFKCRPFVPLHLLDKFICSGRRIFFTGFRFWCRDNTIIQCLPNIYNFEIMCNIVMQYWGVSKSVPIDSPLFLPTVTKAAVSRVR